MTDMSGERTSWLKRHREQTRESRKKQKIIKKENAVIAAYVKAKNPVLYNEARDVHLDIDAKYPMKNNLLITDEFRVLVKDLAKLREVSEQQQQRESNEQSDENADEQQQREINEQSGENADEQQQQRESNEQSDENADEQQQRESNEQSDENADEQQWESNEQQQQGDNFANNITNDDLQNMDRIVAEIIQDLERQQPDILDYFDNDDDEGVDLNIFDEVMLDVEEFNYEHEVEPFEW